MLDAPLKLTTTPPHHFTTIPRYLTHPHRPTCQTHHSFCTLFFYHDPSMNLQENKDKADIISKLIDSLYKKLIVLLAIDGVFGTYALKYIEDSFVIGCAFAIIFIFSNCRNLCKNEFMDKKTRKDIEWVKWEF